MRSHRLIIFWSFVVAIIVIRLVVLLLDRTNTLLLVEPRILAFRIHHITPGMIIVLVSGYLAIATKQSLRVKKALSISYGIGLALVIDELIAALVIQSKYWFITGAGGEFYYKLPTYILIAATASVLLSLAFFKKKD